ncbi:hypothetical protein MHBO_001349 [Bonamia ostreae]|uniref:Uncharacterized protein n=1 Tax=Bonamia ostreae TaxID=126728 RepID=A0ABV2AJW0_9EUKA
MILLIMFLRVLCATISIVVPPGRQCSLYQLGSSMRIARVYPSKENANAYVNVLSDGDMRLIECIGEHSMIKIPAMNGGHILRNYILAHCDDSILQSKYGEVSAAKMACATDNGSCGIDPLEKLDIKMEVGLLKKKFHQTYQMKVTCNSDESVQIIQCGKGKWWYWNGKDFSNEFTKKSCKLTLLKIIALASVGFVVIFYVLVIFVKMYKRRRKRRSKKSVL